MGKHADSGKMKSAQDLAQAAQTRDPLTLRFRILMLVCMLFAGALVTRAAFIQVANSPALERMAKRQFQSKVLLSPRRGTILDRNGEPLAINLEAHSLAANPNKIQNKRILARLLAKTLNLNFTKIFLKFKDGHEFVWLKRHLTNAEMNQLKKWKMLDGDGDPVTGLLLVKESQRVYPHGELGAHVLGGVNVDSEGTEGIELWQNEKLRGKVASVNAIKDALGRPTFIDSVAAKSVQDGEPLGLTLDASLQFAVENELKAAVHKSSAKGGTAIVMNAVTGEILAMANEPSFNANDNSVNPERRRNRALTDGYEPGSTLKAVLLASALSHGSKLTDQVWGNLGQMEIQGHKISESEAKEKFAWISLKKVIQVSSNVGAAKIALKLGADNYLNTLKAFGFGSKSGLGFPGEISGRVPPRKGLQPLTLANIGFGQGVLVTPLQMIKAYATFLNGGWDIQPTMIKSDEKKGAPPRRILSQAVSDQVVEALQSVTQDEGTGVKARVPGYEVAGKTGTAQKVDPTNGHYSRSSHIASFIGFALNVDPKIVIFTSIDEPHGVYYASETAAPLFSQVLNAVASRFSLPTNSPVQRVLANSKAALQKDQIKTHQAKAQLVTELEPTKADLNLHWMASAPNGDFIWKMPSLKGLTPREAIRALQGHRFAMEIKGTGIIRSQFPEEGKALAEGQTVKLSLAEP